MEFTENRINLSNDGENKYLTELFERINPDAQKNF